MLGLLKTPPAYDRSRWKVKRELTSELAALAVQCMRNSPLDLDTERALDMAEDFLLQANVRAERMLADD